MAPAATAELSHVASVASFFVSRVDTEVDHRLEPGRRRDGRPRLWPCGARPRWPRPRWPTSTSTRAFTAARWEALRAGARVQRPLWASTSTKNPAYPDLLYIDDADRAGHGQHHARGHARGLRGSRHAAPHGRRRSDAAAAELARLAERASTWPTSSRRSRTKAWPPSPSRSTSCCSPERQGRELLVSRSPRTRRMRDADRRRRRGPGVLRGRGRRPSRASGTRASRWCSRRGPVARACYDGWPARPTATTIDWSMVDLYMGDERFVPHAHDDANVRLIPETLLRGNGAVGSFQPLPTGGAPPTMRGSLPAGHRRPGDGPGHRPGPPGPGTRRPHGLAVPHAPSLDADPGELVVANDDPPAQPPPAHDPHLPASTRPARRSSRGRRVQAQALARVDARRRRAGGPGLCRDHDLAGRRCRGRADSSVLDWPRCSPTPISSARPSPS